MIFKYLNTQWLSVTFMHKGVWIFLLAPHMLEQPCRWSQQLLQLILEIKSLIFHFYYVAYYNFESELKTEDSMIPFHRTLRS